MIFLETTNFPSGEAIVFLGLLSQGAAIIWIWQDWQFSQYNNADWRKEHRQSETKTLATIDATWRKFSGGTEAEPIDWDEVSSAEAETIAKIFPLSDDDEALCKRKIETISTLYGVGPSDMELKKLRAEMDYLVLLRRGVADYKTFVRRKTIRTALALLLAGSALQMLGSYPSRWTKEIATPESILLGNQPNPAK